MYDRLKNHISTNFLALAGYPLLWYIKDALVRISNPPNTVFNTNSVSGFEWFTSVHFCPYMFLTLVFH